VSTRDSVQGFAERFNCSTNQWPTESLQLKMTAIKDVASGCRFSLAFANRSS